MKALSPKKYDKAIQKPGAVLVAMPGATCPYFKDSVTGICDKCNRTIHYRPYNEKCTHKLCLPCADEMVEKKMEIDEFLKEPRYHG